MGLKIRRALISVSDKKGVIDLARALENIGCELVATGRTASVLEEAGLTIIPIEDISGNPEAFQGRMKTLSFNVCSGILHRRDSEVDLNQVKELNVKAIDCVVVNFYPFEKTVAKGASRKELIENIDIGGPTLVRAAAKNSPQVAVLTDPSQYEMVIKELKLKKEVAISTVESLANRAWDVVSKYDSAISKELGQSWTLPLRYGENPHQSARLELDPDSPIAWDQPLTDAPISYNNILDLSGAYDLMAELVLQDTHSCHVVIVKHGNPCGVASVPKSLAGAQMHALTTAWEGDEVSAFGGIVLFSNPIEERSATWLAEKFIEVVAAPELGGSNPVLALLTTKRKNLKALEIKEFRRAPREIATTVAGGTLCQSLDEVETETFKTVTKHSFPTEFEALSRFGLAVVRSLKSNAVCLVREPVTLKGARQLIGAGQGQPNRIEAFENLALPRARRVLKKSGGKLSDAVLISDAFFPFPDIIESLQAESIRYVVQPGGSIKDKKVIEACDRLGVSMAITGVRHFRH